MWQGIAYVSLEQLQMSQDQLPTREVRDQFKHYFSVNSVKETIDCKTCKE